MPTPCSTSPIADGTRLRGGVRQIRLTDLTTGRSSVLATVKAKALAQCEVGKEESSPPWRENQDLMAFLRSL